MRNRIIFGIISIIAVFIFFSCEKEDKYKDYQSFSTANPVCGDYIVNWYSDYISDTTIVGAGTVLSVYNTANDASQIWIDDNGKFWTFKTKAILNGNNFSVTNGIDIALNDTTTIKNGSVNGNTIYMELKWSSDPATTYVCTGSRRTGFE